MLLNVLKLLSKKNSRKNKTVLFILKPIIVCILTYTLWLLSISLLACFWGPGIAAILGIEGAFVLMISFFFKRTKEKIQSLFIKYPVLKIICKRIIFIGAIAFVSFACFPTVQAKGSRIVTEHYPQCLIRAGENLNLALDNILKGKRMIPDGDYTDDTPVPPHHDEEQTEYSYSSGVNFILLDPDSRFDALDHYISTYLYTNRSYLYSALEESVFSVRETKTPVFAVGSSVQIYNAQRLEDDFLERIDIAHSLEINTTEWRNTVPDSSALDTIIEFRNSIITEGTHIFDLYNKLSNNYQAYADEYLINGTNSNAVLYYYLKSVEMDMQCLAYCQTDNEFYTAIERLYMRYHDIAGCDIIDSAIRDKANEISKIVKGYYSLTD